MFDPTAPLAKAAKASVPMSVTQGTKTTDRARPASKIVAKDDNPGRVDGLTILPDGRLLLGYSGPFVVSDRAIQIREGDQLTHVRHAKKSAPPIALHPDGQRFLAAGTLAHGYESYLRIVTLPNLEFAQNIPLRPPFLWLPGDRIVGQLPAFPEFESEPYIDPKILDEFPDLRKWMADRKNKLMIVDPAKKKVVGHIPAHIIGPEYPVFNQLAISPDEEHCSSAPNTASQQ